MLVIRCWVDERQFLGFLAIERNEGEGHAHYTVLVRFRTAVAGDDARAIREQGAEADVVFLVRKHAREFIRQGLEVLEAQKEGTGERLVRFWITRGESAAVAVGKEQEVSIAVGQGTIIIRSCFSELEMIEGIWSGKTREDGLCLSGSSEGEHSAQP